MGRNAEPARRFGALAALATLAWLAGHPNGGCETVAPGGDIALGAMPLGAFRTRPSEPVPTLGKAVTCAFKDVDGLRHKP